MDYASHKWNCSPTIQRDVAALQLPAVLQPLGVPHAAEVEAPQRVHRHIQRAGPRAVSRQHKDDLQPAAADASVSVAVSVGALAVLQTCAAPPLWTVHYTPGANSRIWLLWGLTHLCSVVAVCDAHQLPVYKHLQLKLSLAANEGHPCVHARRSPDTHAT